MDYVEYGPESSKHGCKIKSLKADWLGLLKIYVRFNF